MSPRLHRRQVLAGAAALGTAPLATGSGFDQDERREFYELRRYRVGSAAKRERLLEHLEGALLPALGRAGLDRVGCFVAAEDEDHDVHLLLPSADVGRLVTLTERLEEDEAYREATKAWDARTEPVYQRIQSKLLHAFASMPVIELPEQTRAGAPRLFELRIYESLDADAARRKVAMFDEGETQLMRDVGLAPVFFGSTRIGHDVPNLTYMLSAEDEEAHQEHWQAFLDSPEWAAMKDLPRFAGTVSRIENRFLRPTDASGI